MKKNVLLLTFTIFSYGIFSQNFQWVKEFEGPTADVTSMAITSDAAGNIYTTGYFSGTVDFDPGAGTYNLTSSAASAAGDAFISKLDASGNFIWAKNIGGTDYVYGVSIVVDATGNVFITGSFDGTIDFDPGIGSHSLTTTGLYDIFILKLNAAGNFVWANTFGDVNDDQPTAIALDASNNVYITGYFSGTVDFDPGTGISNLNSFNDNAFILKLGAPGNLIWAKSMESGLSQAFSIKLDNSGNIYTTGFFQGTVDFNPNLITVDTLNASSGSIYISKLNSSGNYLWAKNMGAPNQYDSGNSINVDAAGNVFTTGFFEGTADFNPGVGTNTLSAIGTQDIFISKLDASGNFVWAKNLGSSNNNNISLSIVIDAAGAVYSTGMFIGTVDFDPGVSTNNITSVGSYDSFILKLNPSGNFVWVKIISSSGNCQSHSIIIDASGYIYTTGVFYGSTNFDSIFSNYTLTTSGTENHSYILKLQTSIAGIEQLQALNNKSINIYPNPNSGNFMIAAKENMNLRLIDNLGQIIQTIELNESNGYQENIKVSASGMYFITGQSSHESINQKIIVTK